MIYVIVGNERRPFSRLFVELLECLKGSLKHEVLVQNGHTKPLDDLDWKWVSFLDHDVHLESLSAADFVVAHAGAGTLIDCIQLGKIPLLLPRLQKYQEHKNNHQLEIFHYAINSGLALELTAENLRIKAVDLTSRTYDFKPIVDYVGNKY